MLPNLLVIGAMKCATTSLHYYLDLHPEIAMSREKELRFFAEESSCGVRSYESQFRPAKVRGETSPAYSNYPKYTGVPDRIARLVPEARLVYVVRSPVDRTISHYFHDWIEQKERRTIAEALARPEDNPYVWPSLYHMQLERYLRVFSKQQILVITSESLLDERAATLRRVFRFLGVDDGFSSSRFERMRHRTALKRRRTPLGRRVARLGISRMLLRLPPEMRGYIEWLLFLPLSRRVNPPLVPVEIWRDLGRFLRADTERFVGEWNVGHDWLSRMAD